ncbi:MAG: carbohydrate ABC transporter permease [Acetanaerobacterium sp.]
MNYTTAKAKKMSTQKVKNNLTSWAIMLPTLILFGFFVWEPLLESIRLSLYSAKGTRLQAFIGFQNYLRVFRHPDFLPALGNTFLYTFWSLVIGFLVPIIIAILISETPVMSGLFRTSVYFPNIMPGLATAMIWVYLFSPGPTGVLNILLGKIGIEPLVWLNNATLSIPTIVVAMTWKAAGSTALIYMAAIGGINPELYEAATIDGAKVWSRIWNITLPHIFKLGKTMLILQIIAVFQILYEPLVMTNGGPNNASVSLMLVVYRFAFNNFNYPMGAALSVIICIILVFLTLIYFRATKDKDEKKLI